MDETRNMGTCQPCTKQSIILILSFLFQLYVLVMYFNLPVIWSYTFVAWVIDTEYVLVALNVVFDIVIVIKYGPKQSHGVYSFLAFFVVLGIYLLIFRILITDDDGIDQYDLILFHYISACRILIFGVIFVIFSIILTIVSGELTTLSIFTCILFIICICAFGWYHVVQIRQINQEKATNANESDQTNESDETNVNQTNVV